MKINFTKKKFNKEKMLNWAQKFVKVAPNKNSLRAKKIFYLLIALICIVILIIIFLPHKKNNHNNKQSISRSTDFQNDLSINLEKLNSLSKKTNITISNIKKTKNNLKNTIIHTRQKDKNYLSRQNAPTTVYSFTNSDSHFNTKEKKFSNNTTVLNDKNTNSNFANNNYTSKIISAEKFAHPKYTIASGEFIHAILETAINSNLPGKIRAVVNQAVYSYTNQNELIPSGSRLIGQYSAGIVLGQTRIMVIWNRIILPNGINININSTGTDAIGMAGMGADSINTHFFAQFSQSFLLSVLGAGAATYGVDDSDQYNSASAYRSAIADSLQEASEQSLKAHMNITPTLRVHQGDKINIFVANDLDFYSVLKNNE